jgi:hypothetical protein
MIHIVAVAAMGQQRNQHDRKGDEQPNGGQPPTPVGGGGLDRRSGRIQHGGVHGVGFR